MFNYVKPGRIRLSADRGFGDESLFALLDELQVNYLIRVTGNVKIFLHGHWRKLNQLRFIGNSRRRNLGRLHYCERSPRQVWITMSRARQRNGECGVWYLVSNQSLRAEQAATEYGYRFCDAKWYLGFAEARVTDIHAWSRLFALFAIALLVTTTLGMTLLLGGGPEGLALLRRVASRRNERCELSLIAAVNALLQQDWSLMAGLSSQTKLNLDATLSNVS